MFSKKIIAFILGVTLLSFSLVTVFMFQYEIQNKFLPIYGKVSNFYLSDTKGEKFTLNHLKDKVWVAGLFFTTCSDICPVMNKNLANLHRSYHLVNDVAFVSITVNPEQDNPQVLAKYAEKFKANPNKWHFLTGSREEITDLAVKSFKMGSMEEPIFHSSKFVLIDRKTQIRGYYEGTDPKEIQILFKDLARLIKER